MFENYSKHGMVLIIFLDLPNPIAFMAKKKPEIYKRKNFVKLLFPNISRVYSCLEVNPSIFVIFRFQGRKQVPGSVWIMTATKRTLK